MTSERTHCYSRNELDVPIQFAIKSSKLYFCILFNIFELSNDWLKNIALKLIFFLQQSNRIEFTIFRSRHTRDKSRPYSICWLTIQNRYFAVVRTQNWSSRHQRNAGADTLNRHFYLPLSVSAQWTNNKSTNHLWIVFSPTIKTRNKKKKTQKSAPVPFKSQTKRKQIME